MHCPHCGEDRDKVIDSRASEGGRAIRRRRQCQSCDHRFTTYEHVETRSPLRVIKADGTRVPYDRQKMLLGLEKACYKRPIAAPQLINLVDEVEEQIIAGSEREVGSFEIGRALSERLKRLDQVAYVRFASVYKQFRDLEDFLTEVREVMETGESPAPGQADLF